MAESKEQSPPPAYAEPLAGEVAAALDDEDINSKKVTLADLSAKGTTLYAHKSYEEASEVFSEASNLQAEVNGETAPENAEILFHYGRSLFKVGQSKSNVLGGPAAVETKTVANGKPKPKAKPAKAAGDDTGDDTPKDEKMEEGDAKDGPDAKKPLFQFTGDENFDESDEDEDVRRTRSTCAGATANAASQADGDGEEQDDEDDDLSIAFEILDLARVCYLKQLEQIDEQEKNEGGKGKEIAKNDSSALRHIKERLADTHDALAEISLENEKYVSPCALTV